MSLGVGLSELLRFAEEGLVVAYHFLSDFGFQGVVGVGVLEEGDQALDDVLGVEGGDPVGLNSLGADFASVLLDVGVVDSGLEEGLGQR